MRVRPWLWLIVVWAAVPLVTAGQVVLFRELSDRPPISFAYLWGLHLLNWLPWALATPLILVLVRRFPFARGSWVRALLVHVPAGILFAFGKLLVDNSVAFLTEGPAPAGVTFWSNYAAFVSLFLILQIVVYWLIVAVLTAREYHARHRERSAVARRLGRELAILEARAPDDTAAGFADRLTVRSAGRIHVVPVHEIDWIEAADYYVELHAGGASHLLRETMARLEAQLDPARFSRIHRSAIVNLDRVRRVERPSAGSYEVILRDGTRLRLSRSRRKAIEAALSQAG